jgi:hypothetical protein
MEGLALRRRTWRQDRPGRTPSTSYAPWRQAKHSIKKKALKGIHKRDHPPMGESAKVAPFAGLQSFFWSTGGSGLT